MLLYVWIDKFRNLKNIGFNLTSKYEFDFKFETVNKKITGELTCKTLAPLAIFAEYFLDIKAIIGKNGSGKSSMIFSTLQSILSDYPRAFTGFIVTDKYIFNRRGIEISQDIFINETKLKEINNSEICNYDRAPFQNKLTEEQAKNQKGYRVIETFLSTYALFYYSPFINYDRVYESETVVAGNGVFEVDYTRFFDLSKEAQIVFDSHSFAPFEYLELKAESELLCHKARESERILEYILDDANSLPFEVAIPDVQVNLNQFSVNFWDVVSRYFKGDDVLESPLTRIITKIELNNNKLSKNHWTQFENELLKRILYFLLRYEVNNRYNFGGYGSGNALTYTMGFFESISIRQKSIKGLLRNYLSRSETFGKYFKDLFAQIETFTSFLKDQHKKNLLSVSTYSFEVPFKNKEVLHQLLEFSTSFFGYRMGVDGKEKISLGLPVFSYDFQGLSGGEKSLLHLLSRFHHYIKRIDEATQEVVIFLDEPEMAFHPQWQKEFITIICNFFKQQPFKNKCQLIITGHSPIIISDLPNENVIFIDTSLESKKPFISHLTNASNTFAANIHSLYADAFFIQNGTIGEFAKMHINNVIEIIRDKRSDQKERAYKIIKIIGDPLIRQRLEDMYVEAFDTKPETLEEEELRLRNQLEYIQSRINENRQRRSR